jgi:hypothetical protein
MPQQKMWNGNRLATTLSLGAKNPTKIHSFQHKTSMNKSSADQDGPSTQAHLDAQQLTEAKNPSKIHSFQHKTSMNKLNPNQDGPRAQVHHDAQPLTG